MQVTPERRELLQTGYTSMMIMADSLQQKLTAGNASAFSAPFDERLKDVARGLVRSCTDVKDVLLIPAQEYAVLNHSLAKLLGRSEFQTLLNDTASTIDEVRTWPCHRTHMSQQGLRQKVTAGS